jgi:flagellar assembly factor FliW
MLINTRDFGEIEVSDENLLTFPVGVFAFEEAKQFALLSPLGEEVYPKWLQATHDFAPCFIVFDPAIVNEDYFDTVKLDAQDVKLLKISGGLTDNNDIRLLVIATVPEDFTKTTLNMKAPIVINTHNNLATQVVLPFDYEFKYPLYKDDWEFECDLYDKGECEDCGACEQFEEMQAADTDSETSGESEAGDN